MNANVSIFWNGRRWFAEDVPIDVTEGGNLLTPGAFTPRRVAFEMPLPGAVQMFEAGHPVEAISATVEVNGAYYMGGTPRVEIGLNGAMAMLELEDAPIEDQSIVPPVYDMQITFRDVVAEEARNFAQEQYQTFLAEAKGGRSDLWTRAYEAAGESTPNVVADPDAPIYSQRVAGTVYPVVFGKPGRNGEPALKAVPIDAANRYILIAGHRTTLGTVTVHVEGDEPMATQVYTTEHVQDADGRDITVVQLDAAASDVIYGDDLTYFVSFDGTASGLPNTASDVCLWLLSQTRGVRVDVASWRAAARRLDGYTLDTAMDSPASAWDILTSSVLPLLPVALVATAAGVGCVIRDLRVGGSRKTITVDTSYLSTGARALPYSGGTGAVEIGYALSSYNGRYTRSALVTQRTRGTGSARRGRTKIDTPWVYEPATAQRIAGDLADLSAVIGGVYTGQLPASLYGSDGAFPLGIGDAFAMPVGTSTRYAIVTGLRRVSDWLEIDALVLFSPDLIWP